MKTEDYIREELIFHLTHGNAHMTFEDAVQDFPTNKINTKFTNGDYTFWHLAEHIRRTQADILNFVTNPNYEEIEWPKDYWPEKDEKANRAQWAKTIRDFKQDRDELIKLIKSKKVDLYKKIPKGTGQTLFREIIVVTDHNAYHLGEFAIMRQVLSAWGKSHKS